MGQFEQSLTGRDQFSLGMSFNNRDSSNSLFIITPNVAKCTVDPGVVGVQASEAENLSNMGVECLNQYNCSGDNTSSYTNLDQTSASKS